MGKRPTKTVRIQVDLIDSIRLNLPNYDDPARMRMVWESSTLNPNANLIDRMDKALGKMFGKNGRIKKK